MILEVEGWTAEITGECGWTERINDVERFRVMWQKCHRFFECLFVFALSLVRVSITETGCWITARNNRICCTQMCCMWQTNRFNIIENINKILVLRNLWIGKTWTGLNQSFVEFSCHKKTFCFAKFSLNV